MPRVTPPKPNEADVLLSQVMAKFLGPENPPVHEPLKWLGEGMGPENPPAHFLAQLLRRGDPYNVMGMGNPLVMGGMLPGAIWKTDAWGRRFKVDVETGQAAAKTAGEVAKEQAEHLARVGAERRAEGLFRNVGFRNPKTGEVIEGSTNHPISRELVPSHWGYYDDGFILPDGTFLNRQEAAKYALEKAGVGTDWPAMESVDAARKGLFGDTLSGARTVFNAGEEALAKWREQLQAVADEMGLPAHDAVVKTEFLRRYKEVMGAKDTAPAAPRPMPQLGPAQRTPWDPSNAPFGKPPPTPPTSPAGPVPTPDWMKAIQAARAPAVLPPEVQLLNRVRAKNGLPPVKELPPIMADRLRMAEEAGGAVLPVVTPTMPPGVAPNESDIEALIQAMRGAKMKKSTPTPGLPPGFDLKNDDATAIIDAALAHRKAKKGSK